MHIRVSELIVDTSTLVDRIKIYAEAVRAGRDLHVLSGEIFPDTEGIPSVAFIELPAAGAELPVAFVENDVAYSEKGMAYCILDAASIELLIAGGEFYIASPKKGAASGK